MFVSFAYVVYANPIPVPAPAPIAPIIIPCKIKTIKISFRLAPIARITPISLVLLFTSIIWMVTIAKAEEPLA